MALNSFFLFCSVFTSLRHDGYCVSIEECLNIDNAVALLLHEGRRKTGRVPFPSLYITTKAITTHHLLSVWVASVIIHF